MNDPMFKPAWAEQELAKPAAFDVAERDMLRAFYRAWYAYHTIPNDKLHRRKQEEAGQRLLEAHQVLQAYSSPSQIARILNG